MDDEKRRAQILQAEEGIRLLAEEMAKAGAAASSADEVRRRLDEAVRILQQTAGQVTEAANAATELSESAQKSLEATLEQVRGRLSVAGEAIGSSVKGIEEAHVKFRASAEEAARNNIDVAHKLESRLSELSGSLTSTAMALQDVMARTLESKLSELSSSLVSTSAAINEVRQEVTNSTARAVTQLRRGMRRQTAFIVVTVIVVAVALFASAAALLHAYGAGWPT